MWHGTARTNFARFDDVEKLKQVCAPLGVKVTTGPENFAMLEPDRSDDGDFPSMVGDDFEEEFFPDVVLPLLQPRSVLVVMCTGADKLRYLSGNATAFMRDDTGAVQIQQVSIGDIYEKAAAAFQVDSRDIAECRYEELPASFQPPIECIEEQIDEEPPGQGMRGG